MFSALLVVHVCNMAFQMVTGRILPEEEFALLAAFLGVLAILQRPLSTLRTAVCYYSSQLTKERPGDIRRLIRKWIFVTAVPSFLAGAVLVLCSPWVADFFHLKRQAPIVIVGLTLPALCWLPVLNGAAQGMQKFKWCSAATMLGALARLLIGGLAIGLLYPACGWAMLGHGMGMWISCVVLVLALWFALHGRGGAGGKLPSMRLYLMQSFGILMAFGILMTADIVMVKHYLPDENGFAFAATLGRMAVFLPGAIVVAMFPKVASSNSADEQRNIFLRSLGLTVCATLLVLLVCFIFPRFLFRIFFGMEVDDSMVSYLRLMSLMMVLASALNITVQYGLALHRFRALLPVGVAAAGYILLVAFMHDSVYNVIFAGIGCNLLALTLSLWLLLKKEALNKRLNHPNG
jgi:O-antigen/teichoic acid export membrane protein